MRPIKFRGMCPRSRKWVYGDFIHDQEPYGAPYPTIFPFGNGINVIEDGFEVDPSTVGQFTGLTDKNGKEIFEGDIISFEDDPAHVVKWNDDFCCWTCWEDSKLINEQEVFDWYQMTKNNSKHYIIHDNPELL